MSGPDYEIVEIPIHVEMHRARADVAVVEHTHQTYATLMGTLGLKLELLDTSTLSFTEGILTYDEVGNQTYFTKEVRTLIRNEAQGRIAAKKIDTSSVIILKSHGPIVVSKSIEEACMLIIALENAAKSQIIATVIGGQQPAIESLGLTPRKPSASLWKLS